MKTFYIRYTRRNGEPAIVTYWYDQSLVKVSYAAWRRRCIRVAKDNGLTYVGPATEADWTNQSREKEKTR